MMETKDNIVLQFKEIVSRNKQPLNEQTVFRGGKTYFYYFVKSNPCLIQFISNLTGINLSFINQYIFVNNFLALLKGRETSDVYIRLVNDDNGFLSFEFSLFNSFDDDYFLSIYLSNNIQNSDSRFKFICPDADSDDYDTAYNDILLLIEKTLDPKIKKFRQIFDISKISNIDFINNRLPNNDFKILSLHDFIKLYSVDDSNVFENDRIQGQHSVTVDYKTFKMFFNDNFSISFMRKLNQIVTLASFQENLFRKKIKWHPSVSNYFSISFNKTSKYSDLNNVYTFYFGAHLEYDSRESIMLYDDGTIEFYDSCNNIMLTDLDSVYDNLKENFILKLEKNFQMNRSEIRLSDLKVYEMLLL